MNERVRPQQSRRFTSVAPSGASQSGFGKMTFSQAPTTHGSGVPLDARTRLLMEGKFGHNFSKVRVHTDTRAEEAAQSVNALAYTTGPNIVFGSGQYNPGSTSGQRLLAHELTHVVQQDRFGTPTAQPKLAVSQPGDASEREADAAASQVLARHGRVTVGATPSAGLARKPAGNDERSVSPTPVSTSNKESGFGWPLSGTLPPVSPILAAIRSSPTDASRNQRIAAGQARMTTATGFNGRTGAFGEGAAQTLLTQAGKQAVNMNDVVGYEVPSIDLISNEGTSSVKTYPGKGAMGTLDTLFKKMVSPTERQFERNHLAAASELIGHKDTLQSTGAWPEHWPENITTNQIGERIRDEANYLICEDQVDGFQQRIRSKATSFPESYNLDPDSPDIDGLVSRIRSNGVTTAEARANNPFPETVSTPENGTSVNPSSGSSRLTSIAGGLLNAGGAMLGAYGLYQGVDQATDGTQSAGSKAMGLVNAATSGIGLFGSLGALAPEALPTFATLQAGGAAGLTGDLLAGGAAVGTTGAALATGASVAGAGMLGWGIGSALNEHTSAGNVTQNLYNAMGTGKMVQDFFDGDLATKAKLALPLIAEGTAGAAVGAVAGLAEVNAKLNPISLGANLGLRAGSNVAHWLMGDGEGENAKASAPAQEGHP